MQLLGEVADQGDAAAHFSMAYEFAVGNHIDAVGAGTPKDPEKALALFHDAADLGNPGAQLLLSHYYDVGFGVKADKAQAYKWALLAVTHGSPVAKQVLPDFEKTLTPEQHAQGQRLAKAWEVTTFEAHEAKYGQAHHQGQAPSHRGHSHDYDPTSFFPNLKDSKGEEDVAPAPVDAQADPEGQAAPDNGHGHPHGQTEPNHGHGHDHSQAAPDQGHANEDEGSHAH